MPAQSFNDSFLGNAPVPGSASPAGSSAPGAPPKAVGMPSGVVKTDGTANLRATTQTFQAAPLSTPGGNKGPKGVQSFTDDRV